MTDNIQQLDSDDGLNVVQIDGTVIEPMIPAFDKINTNFETVLTDTTADATTKADAAEAAAKAYADGILTTETTNRESADLTLQSNIDAEVVRATSIESGLRTDVDSLQSQVADNDSDILSLQGLVGGDVSDLQSQIDSEVARATAAEGVNANAIATEKTRAEGIEAGLRTDVDSIQAQITANDSDITALQTLQSGDVSGLQSQLDAEVTRATGVESGLRTDVDTVTGRVDTLIGTSPETLDTIQEIVIAFEDADSDLQQVIVNNSSRLTTTETDIDAVEVRATDLESRATTTEGNVTSVQGEINTLQSEMNAVESRATSLETDVTSLEVRTTDLETTVTQTQSKVGTGSFDTTAQDNVGAINEVHTELDSTVSRVDGHDTVVADLQTQITSEVTRATAQESTILSELAASSGVLDNQNSSGNPIKLWTGTQSQYSALTPDPDTLYFITG